MPTLAVARDYLFNLIGRIFTQDEFEKLCFEFGIELDDVTSERDIFMREQAKALECNSGSSVMAKQLEEVIVKLSDNVIYKIDTCANRYDLLSAESMAIAIKVFMGMTPPMVRLRNAQNPLYRMVVDKSVMSVRDYVVCAVLRNIKFTKDSFNSFIDFQEKLHSGLARRRTLASVGTHDLDKIAPSVSDGVIENDVLSKPLEFYYKCIDKQKISFIPLDKGDRVLNCAGNGLEEFYKADRHISKFIPLISEFPQYPTINDYKGRIMSLPPIINSDFSKIDMNTRNIFIECTAPDYYKASNLVNQIVCAFSCHCDEQFQVDAVEVRYPEDVKVPKRDSNIDITPDVSIREMMLDVPTVRTRVGVDVNAEDCAALLKKMYLYTEKVDENRVKVGIPPIRCDILDHCDLIEDVAIAYGYDNIPQTPVPTVSFGIQCPVNKLSHLLRIAIANAGYLEMLNFSLCSRDEAFKTLGRVDNNVAVHIANPQTIEFQVCRPSLLPGALKTFAANKSQPLPIKLFEVSDVVLLGDAEGDVYPKVGSRNRCHFCALHCTTDTSGFEDIHGLVEYVFLKLGVPTVGEATVNESLITDDQPHAYQLQEGFDGAFFTGRCMEVIIMNMKTPERKRDSIGHLGVIHPNTLKAYDIPFPCSYCELDIQYFV